MRTQSTLTLAMLAAFTAGCADSSSITGSDAGQPNCAQSNSATTNCALISSLRPSASVFYEHSVTGFWQTTWSSFAQPTAEYLQGTTKIDISSLTEGSTYTSITDGIQTVDFPFGGPVQRRTVPSSWFTWSSPPHSESSTPLVLFTSSSNPLMALTFSQPVATVGFELEGNTLGPRDFLVEFYDDVYQLLGWIVRTVESNGGARLFSFTTDWPKKISRIDISGVGEGTHFGIAQIRYSLTPVQAPTSGISIDIKPGTTPNDVHRSSKGRLPVALLTTSSLNAADLNVASIRLGNETGQDTPVAMQSKGTPMASLKDVDLDGDLDLILQFDIPALVANGDLTASTTQLALTGTKTGGGAVRGVDNVVVKP